MKRKTTDTIFWIFCIIILVTLTVKVHIEASDYECDECTIQLSNKIAGSEYFDMGEFKVKTLFEAYAEGECLIKWSPTQGYMKNGYTE